MANFHLYKYKFSPSKEEDLFVSDDTKNSLTEERLNKMMNDALKSAFDNKHNQSIRLFDTPKKKDGTQEPEFYTNCVVHSEYGVTLLQVRNNKTKEYMPADSNEAQKIGHFPYCYVIIDTRPDSQFILIQQKAEAFSSTETVERIIANWVGIEFKLFEIGWKYATKINRCKGELKDVVKTRLRGGKDSLKSLIIKFDDKKPNPQNEVDSLLQRILEKFAAPDGELKMNSSTQTQKMFEEEDPELMTIITLLVQNHYRVKVGFNKSGSYEYGKNTVEVYGMDDKYLDDFGHACTFNDEGVQGFDLVFWLDNIKPDDTAHEYAEHGSKAKRKKHNAKKQAS